MRTGMIPNNVTRTMTMTCGRVAVAGQQCRIVWQQPWRTCSGWPLWQRQLAFGRGPASRSHVSHTPHSVFSVSCAQLSSYMRTITPGVIAVLL